MSLPALCGCSSRATPTKPIENAAPVPHRGPVVDYRFESLDERAVSLDGLKGRATAIAFITTFGDASIVQARFLRKVFKDHVPRINAAVVFMEPVENRPLARVFRDAVGLPFPAAMASPAQVKGEGPFAGLDTVPSVVVLDPSGHEVWRKTGAATPEELVRAVRDAQREVWGPR
jgi:hypothetical protein